MRFKFFSLAAWMIALAGQFGHAASIGTGSAAIFGSIRENTVTSGMRAFSKGCVHLEFLFRQVGLVDDRNEVEGSASNPLCDLSRTFNGAQKHQRTLHEPDKLLGDRTENQRTPSGDAVR